MAEEALETHAENTPHALQNGKELQTHPIDALGIGAPPPRPDEAPEEPPVPTSTFFAPGGVCFEYPLESAFVVVHAPRPAPYTQRTIILPRRVADPGVRRAFEVHVRLRRVEMVRAAAGLGKRPQPRGGVAWFVPVGENVGGAKLPQKFAARLWERSQNRPITKVLVLNQLQAAAALRS